MTRLTSYVHNAHGVGEAGALLPSGDHDDGVAGLDEPTGLPKLQPRRDTRVHVFDPVRQHVDCVVDGEEAAVDVALPSHLRISRDRDDWALGPVLGNEVSGPTGCRDYDDRCRLKNTGNN